MVNAQTAVAPESKFTVIPPRITFLRLLEHAKGIGQPEVNQSLKVLALFGGVVNGFAQALRVVGVAVVDGDVEVTYQHQPRMRRELFGKPMAQAVQPLHLVVEFVSTWRLAVDKIPVDHPHVTARSGQGGCNHA